MLGLCGGLMQVRVCMRRSKGDVWLRLLRMLLVEKKKEICWWDGCSQRVEEATAGYLTLLYLGYAREILFAY